MPGLGFGVCVSGSEFKVKGLGFGVLDLGFRVQGFMFIPWAARAAPRSPVARLPRRALPPPRGGPVALPLPWAVLTRGVRICARPRVARRCSGGGKPCWKGLGG